MKRSYKSGELRKDSLFLRNDYKLVGSYNMPLIKKCDIDISSIKLLGVDKVCITETSANIEKTIHFFVDDYKLDKYYYKPQKYLERLAQYPHLLTPDFSLYTDMPIALQIYNTFRSRWCGAYWQDYNLSVIPTVGWSTNDSYSFCFDGLEEESVVSISTIGNLLEKELFLRGYFEMIKRIKPKQILCFGKAFPEMGEEVIVVDYLSTTGRA